MLSAKSYRLPLFISLMLHGLIIVMLFVHWPKSRTLQEPVPKHVIAEVISVESAAEKERKRKALQQQRQKEQAQKRAEAQKKQAAEQKKREAALKAAAEKKIKDDAIKAKAEAAKKQAEQQRQQQQTERELQERLLEEQLSREQKDQEEAQKQAERASVIEASFMEQIQAHVSSYWQYPSVVRPEEETEVKITLVPTGQVIQVIIVKGSGNLALDRSVEQAIRKASPLPVPKDIHVFEKSFRNFTIKFRPENASW